MEFYTAGDYVVWRNDVSSQMYFVVGLLEFESAISRTEGC
jgi:hypothetical protein